MCVNTYMCVCISTHKCTYMHSWPWMDPALDVREGWWWRLVTSLFLIVHRTEGSGSGSSYLVGEKVAPLPAVPGCLLAQAGLATVFLLRKLGLLIQWSSEVALLWQQLLVTIWPPRLICWFLWSMPKCAGKLSGVASPPVLGGEGGSKQWRQCLFFLFLFFKDFT